MVLKKAGRPASKMNDIRVRMLRTYYRDNPEFSIEYLANYFGISTQYCRDIALGRRFKHLPIYEAHQDRPETKTRVKKG